LINELCTEAFKAVAAESNSDAQIEISILMVEYEQAIVLEKAFAEKYHEIYGHLPGDRN